MPSRRRFLQSLALSAAALGFGAVGSKAAPVSAPISGDAWAAVQPGDLQSPVRVTIPRYATAEERDAALDAALIAEHDWWMKAMQPDPERDAAQGRWLFSLPRQHNLTPSMYYDPEKDEMVDLFADDFA